jgi:NTE family protein
MLSIIRRAYDKSSESGGPPAVAATPAPQPPRRRRPKIGIALGAGAARGWSHIGILRELDANGIRPDIVAGTSIGAVVGGFYAAGRLAEIEEFARSLTRRRIVGLLDLSFAGTGIFSGSRLRQKLESALAGIDMSDLPIQFAAVATEIGSGHEVWLRQGLLSRAVSASYALPGLLEPVRVQNRWLFDGALVNPVPVSVCRALGADIVIAVSLVSDTMFRGTVIGDRHVGDQAVEVLADKIEQEQTGSWWLGGHPTRSFLRRHLTKGPDGAPGIASVMLDAFMITQDRIARSRLAGDPPDVLMNTRLESVGLFDFHKAAEMIEMGRETVRKRLSDIRDHLDVMSNEAAAR